MSDRERAIEIVRSFAGHPVVAEIRTLHASVYEAHDKRAREAIKGVDEYLGRTGQLCPLRAGEVIYSGGDPTAAASGLAMSLADTLIEEIAKAIANDTLSIQHT